MCFWDLWKLSFTISYLSELSFSHVGPCVKKWIMARVLTKLLLLPSSAPVGNFSWNWVSFIITVPVDLTWPDPAIRKSIKTTHYSKTCFLTFVILFSCIQIGYLQMEDDLSLGGNGRQSQFFKKWKKPSNF